MRITIVTPSFGQIDWLRLCVASVKDQINTGDSLPPLAVEHIVQDAGTPGIEYFAHEVGADYYEGMALKKRSCASTNQPSPDSSLYKVTVYNEKDMGMYDAINRGLHKSTGDICAWLNCDEQYLSGTLRRIVQSFTSYPKAQILCGDVIVTRANGDYLCSRTALVPQRLHTLVSGNLSFLSAATFFRRQIIDAGFFLPNQWRIVGDSVWTENLLRQGIRFQTIREYLSVFADTGRNLSVNEQALQERHRLAQLAPLWARWARKIIISHYRLRKLLSGGYMLSPFNYSIYSQIYPNTRTLFQVAVPTQIWSGRL